MTKRVCVVTTSRADYGLLLPLMRSLRDDSCFDLQVAVSGSHLSPEFGETVHEIESDGFPTNNRVEMLVSSDSGVGVGKSIGLGVIGFADLFARLNPGLLVLLGDRFEMLAAASAALVQRIPTAHLCGGDVTEGAYDEAIRHSLTKMSHLHFVTNSYAAQRVARMGESPAHIHNVGSTGLDLIRTIDLPSRSDLAQDLGLDPTRHWIMVTFHPATLDMASPLAQLEELLAALDMLPSNAFELIVTQSNADNAGRSLAERVEGWAADTANAHNFSSLGQRRYLGCVAQACAVVGNSSSGLYEAPSLKTPTVNIGKRQKGRLRGPSVFDCAPSKEDIGKAIELAMTFEGPFENPYGDGHAAARIMKVLSQHDDFGVLLQKSFYDEAE